MIWMIDMSAEYALWKYNFGNNIKIKGGFFLNSDSRHSFTDMLCAFKCL